MPPHPLPFTGKLLQIFFFLTLSGIKTEMQLQCDISLTKLNREQVTFTVDALNVLHPVMSLWEATVVMYKLNMFCICLIHRLQALGV